ncbi:acyl-CoA thioesterase [Novosphingobium sp. 1949]|uniref:Acyl-CoA thioesterase n=1 Tax=Novosphingobium organovorum TaxID=2930092 RepID=A0ABT0BAY8_9SPHN|nr:thioesterase family protein [Novosphingobium organovorum]MCJ2182224.1 acyl-CoA thioesterase [Novosphingobium organovorum]
MAKPDPDLLDPTRYPHSIPIAPRFADLDPNRHINNVAMAAYLEDARVRFYDAIGIRHLLRDTNVMIVSLAIEYLGEAQYPAALEVHSAIERLGRTSLTLVHLLRQEGRLVAFARCVMVAVDAERQLVPVPEGLDEARLRPLVA